MRVLALVILLAVSACSAPPEPAKAAPPQADVPNAPRIPVRIPYRVQQRGGGLGIFVDEAAVVYEIGDAPNRVWVMERRRRDQKMGVVTTRADWVDGRTCPALEAAIARVGKLPPVGMAGLDTHMGSGVSDSSEVTLMGSPARGAGDFVLRRDTMGPVDRWWQDASQSLETCWQTKQPYIAGAYDLRARLGSAQDEVEVMSPTAR